MPDHNPPPDQETPPEKSSGGLTGWLIVIIIVMVVGYSYQQGWLDKPLAALTGTQVATPAEPEVEPAATPDKAPPVEVATKAPPTPPAPTPQPLPPANDLRGVITQLEAIQSRLIKLENETYNLQVINENLAEQVDRQTGGTATSSYTPLEVSRIELSIIDLHLRITGDTHAAIRSLEELAARLDDESTLQPVISENRSRLTEVPTRSQLLELFAQLDNTIGSATADARGRLNQIQNQEAVDAGVFETIFSVKHDDSELLAEVALIDAVSATVEPARTALIQGTAANYEQRLLGIRAATDQLSSSFASVHSTAISQVLSRLINFGFPQNYLVLRPLAPE